MFLVASQIVLIVLKIRIAENAMKDIMYKALQLEIFVVHIIHLFQDVNLLFLVQFVSYARKDLYSIAKLANVFHIREIVFVIFLAVIIV